MSFQLKRGWHLIAFLAVAVALDLPARAGLQSECVARRIRLVTDQLSEVDVSEVSRVILNVESSLGADALPEDLRVHLDSPQSKEDSSYIPGRVKIDYPRKLANRPEAWKDASAIIGHELGHAVLDRLLSKRDPEWAKNTSRVHAVAELEGSVQFIESRIKDLTYEKQERQRAAGIWFHLGPEGAPKAARDALEEARRLEVEIVRLKRSPESRTIQQEAGDPRLARFYDQVAPYHELFADLIPVLVTRDPQCVSSGLKSEGNPNAKFRDFSQAWDLSTFSNQDNPYRVLAPFRNFLWKNYISAESFPGNERMLVEALADAIAADYKNVGLRGSARSDAQKSVDLFKLFEDCYRKREHAVHAITAAPEIAESGATQLRSPPVPPETELESLYRQQTVLREELARTGGSLDESREARNLGNQILGAIRMGADHLLAFYSEVGMTVPSEVPAMDRAMESVRQFLEKLPANANEWESGEIHRQIMALRESWEGMQAQVNMQKQLASLRGNSPALLESNRVQRLLRSYVADSVEWDILAETSQQFLRNSTGRKPRVINLASFFWLHLSGQKGVFSLPKHEALRGSGLQIVTDNPLFTLLFHEIVKNADEAGERRHSSKNMTYVARVSFQQDESGTRISVEDFGDPSQLSADLVIGKSTPTKDRAGFGVGRYRTELISKVLGYPVTQRAKEDGSGSIVEVLVPAR